MTMSMTLSRVFAVGATLLLSAPAWAHISLLEPAARYNGSISGQSKACPCGVGQSNRLCDIESDRSDDFRSPRVATLEPGSTVTLQWDEYVGHSGRYRVAFDPDGADQADFNANILLDIVDPPGSDGNIGDGSIWEVEVTLPDTPCNNCTLQLIQMMDGDMSEPVLDPVGRSTYYQCADIVIAGAGSDMGGPAPDAGPNPGNNTVNPTPDMGTVQPTPDSGPTSNTPDSGQSPANVDAEGGCACGTAAAPVNAPLAALCVVAAVGRRRRRRSTADR